MPALAADGICEFAWPVHEPGDEAPPHLTELARTMQTHAGVHEVLHEPTRGLLVVRYDERQTPVRMLRAALLDRVTALRSRRRLIGATPVAINVAHEVPGRVRFRLQAAASEVASRLASFLAGLPGVDQARTSPATGSVLVLFDPEKTSSRALLAEIARTPPASWPAGQPAEKPAWVEWAKAGSSFAVMASAVTGILPVPVLLGAVGATAVPPFRRAFRSLASRRVNVDVMDATAITVCLVRSEPITASIITMLLSLGDLILDRTQARTRAAISRLMQLDDGEAFVVDAGGGAPRRVHPRELRAGMQVVVYPGGRVPADGRIVQGSLSVDEKALTGESIPRDRVVGDGVLAASVVVFGQAVVEVERAGGDTVAARIVRILEGAGAKPMTLQRNAERYADRLVLPTFATAGAAWAASGAVDRLTSVLITDFGTGVRVAVPTAALAAMTMAAGQGVLVKGATFFERLAEADTIVFDKTGTLTRGVPEVTHVVRLGSRLSDLEIAAFAAAAEGNQTHPIADTIRRHAAALGAPAWAVEGESYRIGLGLEARVRGQRVCVGNPRMLRELGIDPRTAEHPRDELARAGISSVILAVDDQPVAVIGYADAPRDESAEVVRALKAGGRRRVLLLSGDARAPVEAIARRVGIDEAIGDVLPEHKADVVRRLKAEGRRVAMVGDGINDAPALAVADVGISLHGGTDVALETADVILLEGGLHRLPGLFALADEAMDRVKQVLGVVLVPNALAIVAGAFGLFGPATAAAINNGSTIAAAVHGVAPLLRRAAQKLRA